MCGPVECAAFVQFLLCVGIGCVGVTVPWTLWALFSAGGGALEGLIARGELCNGALAGWAAVALGLQAAQFPLRLLLVRRVWRLRAAARRPREALVADIIGVIECREWRWNRSLGYASYGTYFVCGLLVLVLR